MGEMREKFEASGNRAVGAGFTDKVLAQTPNLTKPALLREQGRYRKRTIKQQTGKANGY